METRRSTGLEVTLDTSRSTYGRARVVFVAMALLAALLALVFVASKPAEASSHVIDFIDDDTSIFEQDITWMAQKGITRGCNPPANTKFCPDSVVTRGQMAAFLVRALDLTDRLDNPFTDDDDSIFEADIERLAAAGITKGCNPAEGNTRFCPDSNVTREQMAALLVRALGYTDDGGGDLFVDDDDSIFRHDIDRLATAGVTKGCNPPVNDRFCPTSGVTRGQMAAFLHRALGQLGREAELMAGLSDEQTPGPGDTDGSGLAVVDFSREGEVCFDITTSNVDTITAAHIHTGALGVAGGVLISFDVPTNGLSGCVAASQAAIDDILTDPAGFYVNLHNAAFPAGAIRGQLGRTVELMAGLSDEQTPGPGDTDGSGLAVVDFSREGEVCFDITTSNVDTITAAHIHTGALGVAGGVLISFDVPTNGLSGCVAASQAAIDDILTDPAGFYVNLHNAAFPAGAIRGQLGV